MNILVLSAHADTHSSDTQNDLEFHNQALSALFIVEAVFKISVLQKAYFKDNFCRFDFVLAIGGLIELIMIFASENSSEVGSVARILRILRIARVGRFLI